MIIRMNNNVSSKVLYTVEQFKGYDSEKKLFALIGYPVGHSMSRFIHPRLFNGGLSQPDYILIEAKPEELYCCVEILKEKACGFNVTIPFKTDIIKYLDYVDEKASRYGAVNTVKIENGKLYGYNTDCDGFVSTLKRADISLSGKKTLLLGAGGVAKMMAFEAVSQGSELTIAARRIEKAQELAEAVQGCYGKSVRYISINEAKSGYHIIINGTPVGMSTSDNGSPVDKSVLYGAEAVFDAIYNPLKTPLLKMAEELSIKAVNGLFMLIYQAAAAQTIWTGKSFEDDKLYGLSRLTAALLSIRPRNIVLTGFMGSGKTSVGKELARRLGYSFIDMDKEIAQSENMSINEIFTSKGEDCFRALEHDLCDKLKSASETVIATGGGVILNEDNVRLLKENGTIVYLDIPAKQILKRLERDTTRPLLQHDDKEARLYELYNKRLPIYKKSADITADASGDINTAADNILEKLIKKE